MKRQSNYDRPASRQGKVMLAVWTNPEFREQVKKHASESGLSVQDFVETVLFEALNSKEKEPELV